MRQKSMQPRQRSIETTRSCEGGEPETSAREDVKRIADNEDTRKTFNLPATYACGLFWCLLYGITRGFSYASQKVGTSLVNPKPDLQYYPLFRCILITIFSYFYGKSKDIDFSMMGWKLFKSFQWETQKQIMWRVFYGYMSYLMAMLCVNYLPLSIASPVLMSSVFITMIMGYLVADEQLSKREITTIVFGFAGVILLLNPQWFSYENHEALAASHEKIKKVSNRDWILGMIFAAGFSLSSAMKYISIRAIGDNVHTSVKNYYFGLVGAVFTLIVNVFLDPGFFAFWRIGTDKYAMTMGQFNVAFVVGLFGWMSQETLAQGLSAVKSGTMAAFQNIAIFIGFFIDIFYFHRTILWSDYLGSGLIVIFTTMQSIFSHLDNVKQNQERREQLQNEMDQVQQQRQPRSQEQESLLQKQNEKQQQPDTLNEGGQMSPTILQRDSLGREIFLIEDVDIQSDEEDEEDDMIQNFLDTQV